MVFDSEKFLARYDVSAQYGFLPDKPPLQRLSDMYYEPWELIMDRLAELIATSELRSNIDNMPILSTSKLPREDEWRRAYLVLSFLTHAYIWSGDEPSQTLPPQLCRPLFEAAAHFDLPSTATYAALNLWNWRPRPGETNLTLPENIQMLHTFTDTPDEEWFYAISVAIEVEGAKIVPDILSCHAAVQSDDHAKVGQLLRDIGAHIVRLGRILDRMHERCDPAVFYHRIRPFLAGSKGMERAGLPRGVFYDEGQGPGSSSWRRYSGGSNAQSSLIQLLDIALGVEHHARPPAANGPCSSAATRSNPGFIQEMRNYMPLPHRRLLQHVVAVAAMDESSSVRAYALSPSCPDPGVRAAYVDAVAGLAAFRDKHINIVARYIVAPSRADKRVILGSYGGGGGGGRPGGVDGSRGTGGTDLMPFLKQCRDETKLAVNTTASGCRRVRVEDEIDL